MKGKNYKDAIWNECRKFYVFDNLNAEEISEIFNGKPTPGAIRYRINQGKWDAEREQVKQMNFLKISPGAIANKIFDRIYEIVSAPEFNTKDADKLAKLGKTLEKFLDPKYQVPLLYQLLTGFTVFIKDNHPKAFSKELVNAARDYKNKMLRELDK